MEDVHIWNHFYNPGPRTDNHLEGYNNSISTFFNEPHPSLGKFIVILQENCHLKYLRINQLQRGAAPTPRNPTYVNNDITIVNSRMQFYNNTLNVNQEFLDNEINLYLNHITYLIG